MESSPDNALAWRCINTIRTLSMDAVEQAQSGHPGTPMALAPAAYLLWTRFLKYNPANPAWADRDRFVLSCGHASMLLYSMLHLTGYDLPMEELRHFRQWGSRTPGHPERGHAPGVEATTGPLGQGLGNAVGMAIAQRILADRFNQPEYPVMNHRIWCFVSDGDLMEGVASEAASIAGHLRLSALKLVYDDNTITIDGHTEIAFSEDVGRRFEAYGWQVVRVEDGNDLTAIEAGLELARRETTRPTLVIMRTVIADPAPNKRNTPEAHGAPLGADEVRKTKEVMGWTEPPFTVPAEVAAHMKDAAERGRRDESVWNTLMVGYARAFPEQSREFEQWFSGDLPAGWDAKLAAAVPATGVLATRQASQSVLNALSEAVTNLVGGSADLSHSTGTVIKSAGSFEATTRGRNLHWGIREHGMTACLNGIAAHGGLRPFGSTFLIFFDYLKPSLRLAALSRLPIILIWSHDSVGLGEDGPTHQPIEQLAMLRAIPNVVTLRPADATETVEAWRVAMARRDGPTVLALTRQKLPILDRATLPPASDVRRGAYVLFDPPGGPQGIFIATGSEVHLALEAARRLLGEGIRARVVSMPSWELFEAQPAAYRDQVLPPAVTARVAIEAASPMGWSKYAGPHGAVIGIDHFGASAQGERIFQEFGFTPEHAVEVFKRVRAEGA